MVDELETILKTVLLCVAERIYSWKITWLSLLCVLKTPYIKVIDQGRGLSEEDEIQLFEPFHTTESSGTGLGLYISKELCEANHATLEYSVTNAGTSCFSIFFSQPQPAAT